MIQVVCASNGTIFVGDYNQLRAGVVGANQLLASPLDYDSQNKMRFTAINSIQLFKRSGLVFVAISFFQELLDAASAYHYYKTKSKKPNTKGAQWRWLGPLPKN